MASSEDAVIATVFADEQEGRLSLPTDDTNMMMAEEIVKEYVGSTNEMETTDVPETTENPEGENVEYEVVTIEPGELIHKTDESAADPSSVTESKPETEPITEPEVLTEEERERQQRKERFNERSKRSGSSVVFADNRVDGQDFDDEPDDMMDKYSHKDKYFYEHVNEYRPRHKKILDRDYEDTIVQELDMVDDDDFDYLYDYMSPESLASLYDQTSYDTIQMKDDFLRSFSIPTIGDVSTTDLLHVVPSKEIIESPKVGEDVGFFVNPLTGEVLPSSESTLDSQRSDLSHIEEKKSTSSDSLNFPIYSDDEEKSTDGLKRAKCSFTVDEDTGFIEFELNYREPSDMDEISPQQTKAKQELIFITNEFLNDLINELMDKSEMLHNRDSLKARCDKNKLIDKLRESIDIYFDEKSVNGFLNTRIVEYFKRQKNFRVLADLAPINEYRERRRYMDALNHFDYIKNRGIMAKSQGTVLMASVVMDLEQMECIVKNGEFYLDRKIRESLNPNHSEYLKRVIDRELKLMTQTRNEISDTRRLLIAQKHAYGRISEKINALEQVSEDLCINDFVAIQNQVVSLDKKIEERNADLKKLLYTYHSELIQTQHDEEKATTLFDMLEQKKAILIGKQQIQCELREHLYQEKMRRTRLHKRQEELSFKGGILSMPALMADYDVTVDKLEEKRVYVTKLKENFKNLSSRVAYYESRQI